MIPAILPDTSQRCSDGCIHLSMTTRVGKQQPFGDENLQAYHQSMLMDPFGRRKLFAACTSWCFPYNTINLVTVAHKITDWINRNKRWSNHQPKMIAKAVSTSGPMLKAVHHHEDNERLFQRRRCKLFHPTRSTTTRALGIDVAIPTKHRTKSRAWGQVSIGRLIYGLNQRLIIRRIKMDQSKSDRRTHVRRPIVLIRHQIFPRRTVEGEEGNSGKERKER